MELDIVGSTQKLSFGVHIFGELRSRLDLEIFLYNEGPSPSCNNHKRMHNKKLKTK